MHTRPGAAALAVPCLPALGPAVEGYLQAFVEDVQDGVVIHGDARSGHPAPGAGGPDLE